MEDTRRDLVNSVIKYQSEQASIQTIAASPYNTAE